MSVCSEDKIYFTNRVKAIPANWKTSQEAAANF